MELEFPYHLFLQRALLIELVRNIRVWDVHRLNAAIGLHDARGIVPLDPLLPLVRKFALHFAIGEIAVSHVVRHAIIIGHLLRENMVRRSGYWAVGHRWLRLVCWFSRLARLYHRAAGPDVIPR